MFKFYSTEEEAIQGHWNGTYNSDFKKGTGWDEEKKMRLLRGSLASVQE